MSQKIGIKNFTSPKFKIMVFSPLQKSSFEIPSDYISGPLISVRSIKSGTGKISFTIKGRSFYNVKVDGQPKDLRFHEIFSPMTFIQVKSYDSDLSKFRQINIGYVSMRAIQISPKSGTSRSINIPTADNLLKENEFFLDLHSIVKDGVPRTQEKFSGMLKSAADLVSKSTNIKIAMTTIWDRLFYKLIFGTLVGGPQLYGGKKIISQTTEATASAVLMPKITPTSYTSNLIMESNLISSLNVGQQISFFDIVRSYSSPPMYEIFADPLESAGDPSSPNKSGVLSIGLPKTAAELSSGWTGTTNYSVPSFGAAFVFRQTPFCYFDGQGKWNKTINPFYEIDATGIKDISYSEDISEIVSGIHVTMNVYENAGSIINPPKYSGKILKIFGQKPLHVKLAGLSPRENYKKSDQTTYKTELDKIRDMLFNIFCNPKNLKIGNGKITIPYQFVRAGVGFTIINKNSQKLTTDMKESLKEIGSNGYIETVTDIFEPSGKSSTELSYKWMESPIKY